MFEVFLGIGGNLGNRLDNIKTAIELISKKIAVPEKISSVFMSEPWGFKHKKYFTNAVLMLKTEMSADEVFNIITGI
ncbi:MAG: 2-amino-4-hydroxy-6-hydroxymethyldihydropteridine diphosphokinase, partial [Bacteroidales bacterium]|nr:2-amino-4-hydroxy-6-hydroxymethyldihydropteridine diphosphokinase [Bacteroidales bacterium]